MKLYNKLAIFTIIPVVAILSFWLAIAILVETALTQF